MATIIYAAGQAEAVNLDNVDFITVSEDDKVVKFHRKQVSNGKTEWIRVATWKYASVQAANTAYNKILDQYGTQI